MNILLILILKNLCMNNYFTKKFFSHFSSRKKEWLDLKFNHSKHWTVYRYPTTENIKINIAITTEQNQFSGFWMKRLPVIPLILLSSPPTTFHYSLADQKWREDKGFLVFFLDGTQHNYRRDKSGCRLCSSTRGTAMLNMLKN